MAFEEYAHLYAKDKQHGKKGKDGPKCKMKVNQDKQQDPLKKQEH